MILYLKKIFLPVLFSSNKKDSLYITICIAIFHYFKQKFQLTLQNILKIGEYRYFLASFKGNREKSGANSPIILSFFAMLDQHSSFPQEPAFEEVSSTYFLALLLSFLKKYTIAVIKMRFQNFQE